NRAYPFREQHGQDLDHWRRGRVRDGWIDEGQWRRRWLAEHYQPHGPGWCCGGLDEWWQRRHGESGHGRCGRFSERRQLDARGCEWRGARPRRNGRNCELWQGWRGGSSERDYRKAP